MAAPQVLEKFAAYFTDPQYRTLWARRVALVTSSALLTLQMERVAANRPTLKVFTDRRAAMAWLLETDRDLAAA